MNPLATASFDIDRQSFDFIRGRLRELTGISLSEVKVGLVQSRLRHRLLSMDFASFDAYVSYLKTLPLDHDEWQSLINQLTTNKTDFFREPSHFQYLLENVVPAWRKSGRNELLVWSAACSTGEEPYTLAIVLADYCRPRGIPFRIVASDIDTEVLDRAQNGVYPQSRLGEVPEPYRRFAFDAGTGDIARWMRVKRTIQASVEFRQCNLISPSYTWTTPFDVIFCRNVFIYFTPETVNEVASRLFMAASPGAVLFIGHSETLQSAGCAWSYVQPSIYRKPS
jgi:chemotaxis methyl-accepting protein methylase